MRCPLSLPCLTKRHGISHYLAGLLLLLLIALPDLARAVIGPRPYIQQIGNQASVQGMAIAPNGYTFVLLPDGGIAVFAPDQVVRPTLYIPGLTSGIAIGTSGAASLNEATNVQLYIATPTKLWLANFSTESGTFTDSAFTQYSLDANRRAVALTVVPIENGDVVVCGQDTTTGVKNFVTRINSNLDSSTAISKVWGQSTSFNSNGQAFSSTAQNAVTAITADASGNVYVAGRWDGVYLVDSWFDFWGSFFSRVHSWNVQDAGLTGLSANINASQHNFNSFFWHFYMSNDAENHTAYILKLSSASLAFSNYTHVTGNLPNIYDWVESRASWNISTISDLKFAANNFLYACGDWTGYSNYGTSSTAVGVYDTHVLRFDASLAYLSRATATSAGPMHRPHSLDVTSAGKVFVSGVIDDSTTTFTGSTTRPVAGKSFYIGMIKEDLTDWLSFTHSNAPAPASLINSVIRWNNFTGQAALAGAFNSGQLSLGDPGNPGFLPRSSSRGNVDFYTLADNTGALINQLGVSVHSEFVQADQVTVAIGGGTPTPLTNFDVSTGDGGISLLSNSTGAIVTIQVPPRIYVDVTGNQVFPSYDTSHNEIAPTAAVTRHICTGFSVTGEATTGATNTYTFVLSKETRVIFNWHTDHALDIHSAVTQDLALPVASGFALGNPSPAVSTTWIAENQPVTAFIDGAVSNLDVFGKRYRVTGFDATGSALLRPAPLPSLPAPRPLLQATATLTSGSANVTLSTAAIFEVGWVVTGAGIPTGASVVFKTSATQFTLSSNATASQTSAISFDDSLVQPVVAATLVKNSADVTLATPTGIRPGWLVTGPGVQPGTTVASVASSTSVTLSKPLLPTTISATTTSPPTPPSIGVDTATTINSPSATVSGSVAIYPGMTVTGVGTVSAGTTVSAVVPTITHVLTTMNSGSADVTVPYTNVLEAGAPVAGTGIRTSTSIRNITDINTPITSTTTNGDNHVSIPAAPPLFIGNVVRGSSIAPVVAVTHPAETTITNIAPVTRSVKSTLSSGSPVAVVGYTAGAELVLGSIVSGTGITPDTTVIGNVNEDATLAAITVSASISVTGVDTSQLAAGDPVSGAVPANTVIQSIDSASTLTLSLAANAAATTLTFTHKRITLSNAAGTSSSPTLSYIIGRTLTLSESAIATSTSALNYVTRLTLTLSNTVTTTGDNTLDYTTAKVLTLSSAALVTARNNLQYAVPAVSTATTVKVASTVGLSAGMSVTGATIPANTTIVAPISATTFHISQSATGTGTQDFEFFATSGNLTFFANFGSYAFDIVRDRQQVPQWLMSGPASITYRWSTQYHVQVSTTIQAASDFPEVRQNAVTNTVNQGELGRGAGEHWYDTGSKLFIGSRFGGGSSSKQLLGWLNASVPAFPTDAGDASALANTGTAGTPSAFYYTQVANLISPVTILWNYGGTIHRETVTIGQAATFVTDPTLSPTQLTTATTQPPARRTVVEGPAGSSGEQMAIWDEHTKQLYPLRPGKLLLEYGTVDDPTIVELTSQFAANANFLHLTHADMGPIALDPSATDGIGLLQLAFSSGNATSQNGGFTSTQNGRSVLVFTQRDPTDTTPANGDPLKEHLVVKVVETKDWEAQLAADPPTPATIGSRLTHTVPVVGDVLDTGFVVHKNARYNASLYDRSKTVGSGPIIPVNRHFTTDPTDDLIVIWFAKPDPVTHIVWTDSVRKYTNTWPASPPRIVLASRLGSEGKDSALNDQLSFTSDRYQNVILYNQPDRTKPGFNPNEEHGLIAPSFKYADQANPPPVAYALQAGGLNVLHNPLLANDTLYTSDPYVLVQYFDATAKESKMAVYAIQAEDAAAPLNPDIDPRNQREYPYTFNYSMIVGEPVQPPYPLARVIGLNACPESFGLNTTPVKAYWEDYNNVAYAAGQGSFDSYFHYRLTDAFWSGEGSAAQVAGTPTPFGSAVGTSQIQITGTIVQGATANAYDGTVTSPVFRTIYTASAANPTFTVINPATVNYTSEGSYTTPDSTPMAFLVTAGSQTATVTLTATSSVSDDDVTTLTATAQNFVDSVNGTAGLVGSVLATLTSDNHLQLESLHGDAITVSDGHGNPLTSAGFGSGQLIPDHHTFTADVGAGPIHVDFAGTTSQDFVNSVLQAFPNGEVSAAIKADNTLRLVVNIPHTIELVDLNGTPLTTLGLGDGSGDPFIPTLSTTLPAGYHSGDTFKVNIGAGDVTVTLAGTDAAAFVSAINGTASLNTQLTASITTSNRIRLTTRNVRSMVLSHDSAPSSAGQPLTSAGFVAGKTTFASTPIHYNADWPTDPAVLKAGETLTYSGGEHRADHPEAPGLPGVIGWAVGEVIFDSMNPAMKTTSGAPVDAFTTYSARLISPLETRRVSVGNLSDGQALAAIIQPATGITKASGTVWKFTKLAASLSRRFFYDPLNRQIGMTGFINDRTLGDSDLTAAPPPVYVLEPDILTTAEKAELLAIPELSSNPSWHSAVDALYKLCRNPNHVTNGSDSSQSPYYVGLMPGYAFDPLTGDIRIDSSGKPILAPNTTTPAKVLGPGLALVPSPAFIDPANPLGEGFVTLVENNDKDIGGPVTLRVIKVKRDERYRGAIKTILADNVFSEQITLRHSGDFGGNADDIVYQWFYREEDGTETALPPSAAWTLFADNSNNEPRGRGQYQIELKGNPILLLADQLFFLRYRHKNEIPAGGTNSTNWAGTKWEEYGSEWAGAANSGPGDYQAQLAQGWVKRVLDRINPYEARFNDFKNNSSPATYSSMIQEAGQGYVGDVALNPDKNVVENVGLIELYQTVLNRGESLSINLSSPVVTPGINNALLLAGTRITNLYMLLGNEAYSDAQDPTIGFGSTSVSYGSAAPSIFCFQNQLPNLIDEELALLRGISQSYGRPVFNRLFWNFTKSEGEVAYAMNYNITDINKDGFIDENDARVLFPQGHGDAWGHYLTAIKSQYNLMRNPYFNWVSRSEFYNLLDTVIKVDFLDERKFADAAAARAKAGAEIVNLTYRSRYVEDPDGQWQGYADTNTDRAWGVDGWARRAGQGAYLDWVAANALIPSSDAEHTGIQKVDRTTVTAIQNVAAQLGKIQSTVDDANSGVNPLGLAADAVPFDFDPNLVAQTPGLPAQTHFEQMLARAQTALANAIKVSDYANQNANRLRMQATTTATLTQQSYEQDRDYRNRLIEIFGTPYEGQIGTGKAYPAGYNGPDIALYMYADVHDFGNNTVPAPSVLFQATWKAMPQMLTVDSSSIDVGATSVSPTARFTDVISRYFISDVYQVQDGSAINAVDGGSNANNINQTDVFSTSAMASNYDVFVDTEPYLHTMDLDLNLPLEARDYTFQAPADWGRRSSPGELQAVISELVQAEANLGLADGDYDGIVQAVLHQTADIRAQHGVDSTTIEILDKVRQKTYTLDSAIVGLKLTSALLQKIQAEQDGITSSLELLAPETGTSGLGPHLVTSAAKAGPKFAGDIARFITNALQIVADSTIDGLELQKGDMATRADIEIQKVGFEQDLRQKLTALEGSLYTEAAKRIEVFRRVQVMRQVSDRYRAVLAKGLALLDERTDFNRKTGSAAQALRYQDMAFRVFRNDALQKYRASFDLAAKYAYLAAKAYDYETNLSPNDPGSAQPLLQDIVRARTLGAYDNGASHAAGGLSDALATLRDNYSVLRGRLGLNNPQLGANQFSLRGEQARIRPEAAYDSTWKNLLNDGRKADLWVVPEFRRFCRPPVARSAGKLPGLVLSFSTETMFGKNFFGRALAAGDEAFNPTNFANKISSAGVSFVGYPTAALASAPQVYLVPAGLDVMTIPNSLELETREWSVLDQALPVPFPVGNTELHNTDWIPTIDGINGPMAEIRRFSSFRAGLGATTSTMATDTRLVGRSVWNTNWLLIIPGGTLLSDGDAGLTTFINNVKDIKLYFNTYGYSGN